MTTVRLTFPVDTPEAEARALVAAHGGTVHGFTPGMAVGGRRFAMLIADLPDAAVVAVAALVELDAIGFTP